MADVRLMSLVLPLPLPAQGRGQIVVLRVEGERKPGPARAHMAGS